jgi:hypothetical protein
VDVCGSIFGFNDLQQESRAVPHQPPQISGLARAEFYPKNG